jgi:pyruvate dehydrogenase E1 component beta subunit
MPSFACDIAALLQASIDDPNPVVFIEDRWIHGQQVDLSDPRIKRKIMLGKANVCHEGSDITVVASGYMSIEALKAISYLKENGVSAELIDLRTIKPLDMDAILKSVGKTKNLLVVDAANEITSLGKEIIANVAMTNGIELNNYPKLVSLPDIPEPTSHGVIGEYRVSALKIALAILDILSIAEPLGIKERLTPASDDVPDSSFTGPF